MIEAMARARSPKDLLVHSSYFIDDKTGIQVRAWLAGGAYGFSVEKSFLCLGLKDLSAQRFIARLGWSPQPSVSKACQQAFPPMYPW